MEPSKVMPCTLQVDSDVSAKLLELIKSLMKQGKAKEYFNTPVDYVKLRLPNYPEMIKKPMDLGKVLR